MGEFISDAKFAKQYEDRLISKIEGFAHRSVKDVRNDKNYQKMDIDVLVPFNGCDIPVEFKCDRQIYHTHNIAYETKDRGHDGCLARTKAEYVIISQYNPITRQIEEDYVIHMGRLREWMKNNPDKYRHNIKMGDNGEGDLICIFDILCEDPRNNPMWIAKRMKR